MKKFLNLTFVILVVVFIPWNAVKAQDQNNFELSKNIEIYIDVLRQLNLNYADDINPGELNTTAIDAMLESLDPYTVYVPESKLEDFELMTKGEYGGIGALIQKQGDYVVITEPYEGFPAQKSGLRAGDKIIAVDGESAKGKSTKDVSEKLKGIPGTSLTITIERFGDTTTQNIEIVREKVKIPNIPYYGMLKDNIGYISLIQFNPNAASEVKKAFTDLKENKGMKAVVLDLRGNGGGLLSEAVDIVNIFVPKGTTVVTTKGKNPQNFQVHSTRFAAMDTKIPLVILVNGNSASASEIVAGAIQDLDRGVIIGERTFGKGLVQNIVSLPYNSRMKMTIAKYYIPSGRCIQAIDYFNENGNGEPDKIPDSLISEFKTAHGRSVYDGKGIAPDIKIKTQSFSQVTADLYAQNYIFNFVNEFVLKHSEITDPEEFTISDETFNQFKDFVTKQDFDYKTETEMLIERIKKSAEREGYIEAVEPVIDSLDSDVKKEKQHDIDKNRKQIEELLRIEIVTRYYYQKGKVVATLKNDPDITETVKVLDDPDLYHSILDGTYEKKEKTGK
ncbi:MAG: S41 family peptidase [Chlorobi bacterium]|nr:S41 family peptidase [Chlorobiota bacterium]